MDFEIYANFVHIVEPILVALITFNDKQCCIEKMWFYHEDIGTTCRIITRSTIVITIEPCRCDQTSILLLVEDANIGLHYTKAFSNPFKLAEVCFHDDVNDKEIFNCVLWKNISSLMT
jgi:hypothetical protein